MRAGLIADVHTDALQRQIQYEATGEPYIMLVLLGNEGVVRLAVGVAFNHYEFTGPLDTRYTRRRLAGPGLRTPRRPAGEELLVSQPAD